jgi:tRNA(Ile)-lysidine synthase
MRLMPAGPMPGAGKAISESAFAGAMVSFEPFEPCPVLAVAVSGGPDSMALCCLTQRWAQSRGGSVLAFTVDHGLRPDSADEARRVAAWLAARGIDHHILRWSGAKPSSGIQNAAREARYRLLAEACRHRGILHLAVGHHADDQAETVLFRRERGSFAEGLAGMSASRSLGDARLIRPLLGWRKASLIATCAALRQDFVNDPSNLASRFARTSLRRRLADDSDLNREVMAQAAAFAPRRVARQLSLSGLLARIAEIRPDGAAVLDPAALSALSAEERQAVLAATLRTIGGREFAPRPHATSRLGQAVIAADFHGASLAGCAIRLWADRVLICRELRGVASPIELASGEWRVWDGRFAARSQRGSPPLTLGALGKIGFSALRKRYAPGLPALFGASLPALRADGKILAAPSIGWAEDGAPPVDIHFTPRWPLSSERFAVVNRVWDIICDTGP